MYDGGSFLPKILNDKKNTRKQITEAISILFSSQEISIQLQKQELSLKEILRL